MGPDRIDRITKLFNEVWCRVPDYNFGRLMFELDPRLNADPRNYEDDRLIEALHGAIVKLDKRDEMLED